MLSEVTKLFFPAIPPPHMHCFLTSSSGGAVVSIQWSLSFTFQHDVERYRVSVTPDPSDCSSDQISPKDNYTCLALRPQTIYTFTISSITECGPEYHEGGRSSFIVQPQGRDSRKGIVANCLSYLVRIMLCSMASHYSTVLSYHL